MRESPWLDRIDAAVLRWAERRRVPLVPPDTLRRLVWAFWAAFFTAACCLSEIRWSFWLHFLMPGVLQIGLINEYCLNGNNKLIKLMFIMGFLFLAWNAFEMAESDGQLLLLLLLLPAPMLLFYLMFTRTDAVYGSKLAENPRKPPAFVDTAKLGFWGRFWRGWIGSAAFLMGLSAPFWILFAMGRPSWKTIGGAVASSFLLWGGTKMLRK